MTEAALMTVSLRPVGPADLPRLYEMQRDPDANRMAATVPRSREAFDAHWAKTLADPQLTVRAILVGDELAGCINRFTSDGQDQIGYWIDRRYWGRAVASRALQLLLQEVTARPLHAAVATDNPASLRVLQKCGFVVEAFRHSAATDRHLECEEALLVLR